MARAADERGMAINVPSRVPQTVPYCIFNHGIRRIIQLSEILSIAYVI